jgi:putative DNA primase/helicase
MQLKEKIMAEATGILQWIIRGCLDWQQNGLIIPAAVQSETDTYFSDQDIIRQWAEDRCTIDLNNRHLFATSAALFKSWSDYLQSRGEPSESVTRFGDRLAGLGLEKYQETTGARRRGWRYICLGKPNNGNI